MKLNIPGRAAGPLRLTQLGILAAASLLLAQPVFAALITVTDLTDGPPVITTDLAGRTVLTLPDLASVNGTVNISRGAAAIPSGVRSVLLMEPGSRTVSDFLTLRVTPRVAGAQQVSVLFESDSAPGFAQAAASLRALPSTRTVVETGLLQDLSQLFNSGSLTIRAQSDVGPQRVPDSASTLLLLGGGLLAVFGLARCGNRALLAFPPQTQTEK